MGMPAPRVAATAQKPLALAFARMAGVSDERIRADLAALPAQLDHVDGLIADGVIGGPEPNAADFQIATTVRVFLAYERPPRAGGGRVPRPARDAAPAARYPGPIPSFLPPGWLPPA